MTIKFEGSYSVNQHGNYGFKIGIPKSIANHYKLVNKQKLYAFSLNGLLFFSPKNIHPEEFVRLTRRIDILPENAIDPIIPEEHLEALEDEDFPQGQEQPKRDKDGKDVNDEVEIDEFDSILSRLSQLGV